MGVVGKEEDDGGWGFSNKQNQSVASSDLLLFLHKPVFALFWVLPDTVLSSLCWYQSGSRGCVNGVDGTVADVVVVDDDDDDVVVVVTVVIGEIKDEEDEDGWDLDRLNTKAKQVNHRWCLFGWPICISCCSESIWRTVIRWRRIDVDKVGVDDMIKGLEEEEEEGEFIDNSR